jgi:hypothetical protein
MFDDNVSNQKVRYESEERSWTGNETSSFFSTTTPTVSKASVMSGIALGLGLALGSPCADPADWGIPPQQPSPHTYSESASANQQVGSVPRISRAEAIRLARANRARIESQLRAEVEREAAIRAVWEEE